MVDLKKMFTRTRDQQEASLRLTLATMVGYALSVAGNVTKVIPSHTQYLIGVSVIGDGFNFPSLMFALGAIVPGMFVGVLLGLAGATLVLAGASIQGPPGMALMVVLYIICVFWMSGLMFGKGTGSLATFTITLVGMNALSLYSMVNTGLRVTAAPEVLGLSYPGALGGVMEAAAVASSDNFDSCRTAPVPGDGLFAGQIATICPEEDGGSLVTIPGGIYIVKGIWTESGIDNQWAIMQNFLITMCWGILVASIIPFMPPFHTMRAALSKGLVPSALNDAASHFAVIGTDHTKDEDFENRLVRLIKTSGSLYGGKSAALTAYEPLLWRPFDCTWTKLKNLSVSSFYSVGLAVTLASRPPSLKDSELAIEDVPKKREDAARLLRQCATALQDGKRVEEKTLDLPGAGVELSLIKRDLDDVIDATNAWVDAVNGSGTPSSINEVWCNFKANAAPWIAPHITYLRRLLWDQLLVFSPSYCKLVCVPPRSQLTRLMWSFKITLGATILFAMTVFWEDFRSFEVRTPLHKIHLDAPITQLNAKARQYAGWSLTSFLGASTQTVEGTIKKGVLRFFGTCLGGFSAWLAFIVCGREDTNPYGLVIWMTVTTFIVGLYSFDDGLSSRLGQSKDHGHFGYYFALTQGLVALESFAGIQEINQMVADRVVANVTGILMAMVMALLPPGLFGGDPTHTMAMIVEQKNAMRRLIDHVLNADSSGTEDEISEHLDKLEASRNDALTFLQDASRFNSFPLFKVDASLGLIINHLAVNGHTIASIARFVSALMEHKELSEVLRNGNPFRQELMELKQQLEQNLDDEKSPAIEKSKTFDTEATDDAEGQPPGELNILMHWVRHATETTKSAESQLKSVRWGCFHRSAL